MEQRTVLIAGSTGLVGKEILLGLLADNTVTRVHSLGRRAPTIEHAKLTSHVVDFNSLPVLPSCDEVYLALGTTIKISGSQAAFRAVDFDANLAVAKAALAAGAKTLGLVSAMGADPASSVFYSRVKGELEEALTRLPYKGAVFARPSLLVGDRKGLGQPTRRGEEIGFAFNKAIGFLIPRNYRPIQAAAVANALLQTVPTASGKKILLSGAMQ
jgi:uncharacterized protein YbjT (DUF2867 family)